MLKKLAGRARSGHFNYLLLVPLLLNTVAAQVVVSMARVTTTYRAVEIDLPVLWLGIISAAFAILPLALAVWVGRVIDRGHDAPAVWAGSLFQVVACAGFVVWPSAVGLFVNTAILGVGQLLVIAGQQMVCIRSASASRFDQAFGNYMVANAVGQAFGPYIVGVVGGDATVPPTRTLFVLTLIAAVATLVFALMLRRSRAERQADGAASPIPLADILRLPGLYVLLLLSVISVTSSDLIVIYLPLLGAERQIDVADIGLLLTVRAMSSIVARLIYARTVALTGRHPLMIASATGAALAFAALAVPLPLAVLFIASAVIGFALGMTTTLSLTGVMLLVPQRARGTANSLRLVGNRIGLLALPMGAGAAAAAIGVGGIFAILAAALAAAAAAAHLRPPGQHPTV